MPIYVGSTAVSLPGITRVYLGATLVHGTAPGDETAPSWSDTSFDAETDTLTATLSEPATVYWLINQDPTPLAGSAIEAGADGSFAVVAGSNNESIDTSALADGTHQLHMTAKDAAGNYSADQVIEFVIATADVTAPVLTSPTDTADGPTTATGSVSTDEGNGTLYWVASTSATAPSAAQVKAGLDHTGAAAADSGSQAVTTTGVQNITVDGLASSTAYTIHYMHEDAATNQSAVVSGDGMTTEIEPLPGVTSYLYVDTASGGGSMAAQSTLAAAKGTPAGSIVQALAAAVPGTAIYLKEGTYNAPNTTTQTIHITGVASGTAANPIWITCQTRHGAIINGPTAQSCIRVNDEQYWRIHWLDIRPNYNGASDFSGIKVESAASADPTPMHLGVYDCLFGGIATDAIKLGTVANVTIEGNDFDGTWTESAIDGVGVDEVVVQYNDIVNAGTSSEPCVQFKTGAQSVTFRYNRVEAAQEALASGGLGTSASGRDMPAGFQWAADADSLYQHNVLETRSTTEPCIEIRGVWRVMIDNNLLIAPAGATQDLVYVARARIAAYQDTPYTEVNVGATRWPYTASDVDPYDYQVFSGSATSSEAALTLTGIYNTNGTAAVDWIDTAAENDANNVVTFAGAGTEASLGVSIGAAAWPGLTEAAGQAFFDDFSTDTSGDYTGENGGTFVHDAANTELDVTTGGAWSGAATPVITVEVGTTYTITVNATNTNGGTGRFVDIVAGIPGDTDLYTGSFVQNGGQLSNGTTGTLTMTATATDTSMVVVTRVRSGIAGLTLSIHDITVEEAA